MTAHFGLIKADMRFISPFYSAEVPAGGWGVGADFLFLVLMVEHFGDPS